MQFFPDLGNLRPDLVRAVQQRFLGPGEVPDPARPRPDIGSEMTGGLHELLHRVDVGRR